MWRSCSECGEPYDDENEAGRRCPRCGHDCAVEKASAAVSRVAFTASPFSRPATTRSRAFDFPPLGSNPLGSHEETMTASDSATETDVGQPAERFFERFGDYELLGEIARGGMGVVFRARQKRPDRIVALKMILGSRLVTVEDVQRFHVEAQAAARLDHPGIVPIHEVGEVDGQHFYAMSFVEGGSLKDFVEATREPLSSRRAAELVRAIAEAVRYAHARNIVHRDLKPANVLLDLEGNPRVTDFGIAKVVGDDSGLTRSGAILGTPAYMPPEQAAGGGDAIGPLADVYALGSLLYYVLTGRPPFRAENSVETLRLVLEQEPTSPCVWNPRVDRDLATICLKCLEKEPSRRYASAAHLVEELDRFLDGLPITARPVGRLERMSRWCRRRPMQALLAGALVVSVVLGVIGTTTFAVLMQRKAVEAEAIARREIEARRAESAARRRAEASEFESILGKAELEATLQPENGWSWSALRDVERALALRVPNPDTARLRTVATRALGSFDVRPVGFVAEPHRIEDLAFSADGTHLYAGVSKRVPDCPILEYEMAGLRLEREYVLETVNAEYFKRLFVGEAFQSGLRAVAVDPRGHWVAGGTRFGEVAIWRRGEDAPPRILDGFETQVLCVEFVLGGRALVATSKAGRGEKQDDELRFYRLGRDGSWAADGVVHGVGRDIALHPNGKWLAHSYAGKLGVLDLSTRKPLDWPDVRGGTPAFTTDGRRLLVEDRSRLASLDTATGRPVVEWSQEDPDTSFDGDGMQFVGDTRYVVTGSAGDDRLHCVDTLTGEVVAVVESAGRAHAPFAVSPDGRFLAVAEATRVAVYEIRTPTSTVRLEATSLPVTSIDLDESGERIAWLEQRMDSRTNLSRVHETNLASGRDRNLSEVVQRGRRWVADKPHENAVRFVDDRLFTVDGTIGVHPLHAEDGRFSTAATSSVMVDDRDFVWPDDTERTVVTREDAYGGTAVRVASGNEPVSIRVEVDTRSLPAGSDHLLVVLRQLRPSDGGVDPSASAVHWEFVGELGDDGSLSVELDPTHDHADWPVDGALVFPAAKAGPDRGRYKPRFGIPGEISANGLHRWALLDRELVHTWTDDGRTAYHFVDSLEKLYTAKLRIRAVAGGDRLLVLGSASGNVLLIDAESGKPLRRLSGPGGEILSVDVTADGSHIVAATDAGRVAAWNGEGNLIAETVAHPRGVDGVRILGGDVVCTAGRDGRLGFWFVEEDQWSNLGWSGPYGGPLRELRWNPSRGRLAWLVEGEHTARVLDLRDLDERLTTLGLPPLLGRHRRE